MPSTCAVSRLSSTVTRSSAFSGHSSAEAASSATRSPRLKPRQGSSVMVWNVAMRPLPSSLCQQLLRVGNLVLGYAGCRQGLQRFTHRQQVLRILGLDDHDQARILLALELLKA